jgi:hypothetical protein
MEKDERKDPERTRPDRVDDPAADPVPDRAAPRQPAEQARRPAPGIKHEPEPDAGNLIPAEDEPGTF